MTTRIGMMIPGAVSLGAYEGGALAALLTAVQASNGDLVIDAISSASAGSMTALIAAKALLYGADPIDLMVQTWVDLPGIENMKTGDVDAPLTMDKLESTGHALLAADVSSTEGRHLQTVPLKLSMALTPLAGLAYAMPKLRDEADPNQNQILYATTFTDFFTCTLDAVGSDGTQPPVTPVDHLDVALASGANPMGFPVKLLDRSSARDEYVQNGIVNPPDPLELWYSDGGDIDNQPLGRLIDLLADDLKATPDENFERVLVMLDIQPQGAPSWKGPWFDTQRQPDWLSTLFRVFSAMTRQSMYDDLLEVEKTNQRIAWVDQAAAALQQSLGSDGSLDTSTTAAAEAITAKKNAIKTGITQAADAGTGGGESSSHTQPATIRDLLLAAAGLDGKEPVHVEVISPTEQSTNTLSSRKQLAGAFLGHFGGFLDVTLRQSDFMLGYRDAQYWLEWWVKGTQQGPGTLPRVTDPGAVLAAVDAGPESLPFKDVNKGGASISDLSGADELELAELAGHIARVVAHDVGLDLADVLHLDHLKHFLHL